ncbi:ABC transporter permease [Halothermothrix orenii]|uniref:ABC-type transport system, involved in lipoprotein release, permease component n=1 Tax=Halothermothrix orenii (strain H 168 / OCM 544 / DSM 9562) TaxID=373903 RepID=B8D1B9_HALOH|nr:FtsX-like permease family protein [Halothermothrix orenii]ACL71071.1 ABC-type transport system, involved in lipoprotein release, permease component [Halothermothrix orenii H 168]
MSYLFKIAFKNLFRHRLRTLVSIVAIAFSVMIVVFARGYIVGLIDSISADHIQYNSGHIKIVNRDYLQQERLLPLNYPVDGFKGQGVEEMASDLKNIDRVEMVIPRLKFGAMVSTDKELITMNGWGVNPEQEIAFTSIEDYLVEGRMIKPGRLEVVMGSGLLNKINRQVGDKVTIVFKTSFNSLRGVTFRIVGRLETGIKLLNEVAFFLPLDQAQRLLYMEGQATELLLVSSDKKLVDQILPEVKKVLAERGEENRYVALGYKETSDLLPYMELAKLIYNQVYIFLVLLASIVVINTMIMIVKERTREIGMMSAMGLESRGILKLFLIEGGIIGTIGSLIGAILGSVITDYFARTGLNFSSATAGFSPEIVFNSIIYPVSSVGNTVFAFFLGVLVVTMGCLIPARRAARMKPTEALREI